MRCWWAYHVNTRLILTKKKRFWIKNLQEASMVPLWQTTWTKQVNWRELKARTRKWIRHTHNQEKTQTIIWTKKKKEEVDHCGLYNSRIKILVLELEFIKLRIESFDLDRWSQELCRLWKNYKKFGVPSCSLIAPSSWIMNNDSCNNKILLPLRFFVQSTSHIQSKQQ